MCRLPQQVSTGVGQQTTSTRKTLPSSEGCRYAQTCLIFFSCCKSRLCCMQFPCLSLCTRGVTMSAEAVRAHTCNDIVLSSMHLVCYDRQFSHQKRSGRNGWSTTSGSINNMLKTLATSGQQRPLSATWRRCHSRALLKLQLLKSIKMFQLGPS